MDVWDGWSSIYQSSFIPPDTVAFRRKQTKVLTQSRLFGIGLISTNCITKHESIQPSNSGKNYVRINYLRVTKPNLPIGPFVEGLQQLISMSTFIQCHPVCTPSVWVFLEVTISVVRSNPEHTNAQYQEWLNHRLWSIIEVALIKWLSLFYLLLQNRLTKHQRSLCYRFHSLRHSLCMFQLATARFIIDSLSYLPSLYPLHHT